MKLKKATTMKLKKATLPPDPEEMNEERAANGLHALKAFQDLTGIDDESAIGDLLADLMHLCDRMADRYDHFSVGLWRAEMHYEAETWAEHEPD
jgi:hypothetical protein